MLWFWKKNQRKMGQKMSVFAPDFLPFSQMTSGFRQMKTEKSEDEQMRNLPVLFFIYAPFYGHIRSLTGEHSIRFGSVRPVFFCVHIQNRT